VKLERGSLQQDWLQPLRWMLAGLPPRDRAIKRYPPDVMSGLLIPLHRRLKGEGPVWVRGSGALAAYLAFGLESLAGVRVAGWISAAPVFPGGLPTVSAAPAGAEVLELPAVVGATIPLA
jgi:hypothetical protein